MAMDVVSDEPAAQNHFAALEGQPLSSNEIYGDDRSIANRLIGNTTASQLSPLYPYASSIEIDPPQQSDAFRPRDYAPGSSTLRNNYAVVNGLASQVGRSAGEGARQTAPSGVRSHRTNNSGPSYEKEQWSMVVEARTVSRGLTMTTSGPQNANIQNPDGRVEDDEEVEGEDYQSEEISEEGADDGSSGEDEDEY